MRQARIGVDIGGTFTDLVLLDTDGQVFFTKVSSTPLAPEEAVLTGVAKILEQAGLAVTDVTEVLHGTTVGSNTLLQKVGAKTGLITTKGFRDVLEIGRVRTPTMFDLTWSKGEPLVERRYRTEVAERTNAKGEVLVPLDPAEIIEIGKHFLSEGIESVAICFLNFGNGGVSVKQFCPRQLTRHSGCFDVFCCSSWLLSLLSAEILGYMLRFVVSAAAANMMLVRCTSDVPIS